MKNVILTGASGMVGGVILKTALADPFISQVTSISRKTSGIQHPKLKEVIHSDFTNFEKIISHFENQDAAYFCIGAYSGKVSNEQFKIITVDFVQAFADCLKEQSPEVAFCLLSGQGADQKEKSRIAFAKYKGMAENYLINKEFKGLHIFRPAYIYPVEKRVEPNLMYRVSRRLYPLLKKIIPSTTITSEVLGTAMFKAGIHGASKTILENEDIKEI